MNTLSGDIAAVGVTTNGTDNFTLTSGKYLVEWSSPFFRGDGVGTQLYNSTDSTPVKQGVNKNIDNSVNDSGDSTGISLITITKDTAFVLRYEVEGAITTIGLGISNQTVISINQGYELYTRIKITRMK